MIRSAAWLAIAVVVLPAAPAAALRYLSLEQAIARFLPAGATPEKITRELTAQHKQRLEREAGFRPQQDQVTFTVGKDRSGQPAAYVFIQDEVFNTCYHKFAIGLTPAGEVIDVAVVELSCPRAVPINQRAFLKQFAGKRNVDALTTRADIDGITGATLSSEVAAIATRKALALHALFFGRAGPIEVPEPIRKARQAGQAEIQRALETAPWAQPDPADHPH